MPYILERLTEPSTWRGVAWLTMSLALGVNPEQMEAIVTIGTSIVGAIGVFAPDPKKDVTLTGRRR